MKAILTTDLMGNSRASRLVITTCPDMLVHMPKIMAFVQRTSISPREIKLSSDFFNKATITIKGESLDRNLGEIQRFLEESGWRKNHD